MTAAITDFSQFTALRSAADNNDPAALREVAGQFEALFLQSMLKNMREASLGDPLIGDSESHEMYQGMLDQQLSLEMASGKCIGLAEMLVRQMGGADPGSSRSTFTPGVNIGPAFPAARAASPSTTTVSAASAASAWDSPESFARDVWPHIQRVAKRLNVAPEAMLAQAALETGWGKHVPGDGAGDSSLNLFGIKAGSSWSGARISRSTLEFRDGIPGRETAQFRAYRDVSESVNDYFRLLTDNPRYATVSNHGDDVSGFATALQSSGYATDPDYATKISRVAGSETMARVLAGLKNPAAAPIQH
ncbi:MAG TPA: flagellar assembly peptidoglycan hydrolase FlgJ [Woeseiaceae bacterium]|nr:flagellar assembly peptidoglycan hydrolase FlgJ [Woeseiaceae bacterium]